MASRKASQLRASRLLVVSRIGLDGAPSGAADEVALDPGLDAGEGDVVLVAKEGAVVADLFPTPPGELPVPANAVIVAVVDDWTGRDASPARDRRAG